MPIQCVLVQGQFRALRPRLLDEIASVKQSDPLAPVVVLVGSNMLGIELRRALAARSAGHVNVRFLTFIDLARELGEGPLLERGLLEMPAHAGELIAQELASGIPEASYFGTVAHSPNFPGSLLGTFTSLREGGLERWPLNAKKTQALAKSVNSNPQKLAQLAALFDAFRDKASSDSFDAADLLAAAAGNAASFERVFGTECLFVYGMYDFNALQRDLIAACSKAVDVFAYVPCVPPVAKEVVAPTLEWLDGLGFEPVAIQAESEQDSDLARLQSRLFCPPAEEACESVTNVELISAPGEVREAREIVRRVARLAREGTPLHRISILLKTPDTYGPLFADLFERAGIPFFLRKGCKLSNTPAGRSVRMLLQLAGSEMSRFDVMELLCYAELDLCGLLGCEGEPSPSQWDRLAKNAGVVSGTEQWPQRLGALTRSLERKLEREGDDEAAAEATRHDISAIDQLGQCAAILFERLDALTQPRSWKALSSAAIELVKGLLKHPDEAVIEQLRSLAALETVQQSTDFETFRAAALEAIESVGVKRGSFGRRGVCICDINAARGLEFDVAIVPGLVEKSFPAPVHQDPILLDAERDLLNNVAGCKVALSQHRAAEEPILLALAVGAARSRIIFSYPRIDMSTGRERIPSSFVLRIGEALAGRRIDYGDVEHLPWCTRMPLSELAPEKMDEALDAAEYDLACAERAVQAKGSLGHLGETYPTLLRAAHADSLRWGTKELTAQDGIVSGGVALPERVSPTSLEEYATCPYRYFLHRVLGVRVEEDVAGLERISSLDRGSLAHRVLEGFFRQQIEGGSLPLRPADRVRLLSELAAVFEREAARLEHRGVVGYPLAWQVDRETLLGDLVAMLEGEIKEAGDLLPRELELEFGEDEAVECELEPGRTIRFQGRIDRLDVSDDQARARVIDYKTGKTKYKSNSFEGGRCLQLPVYLLAARGLMGCELEQLQAEYRKVEREDPAKRAVFSGETLSDRSEEFREILSTIVGGMEAGLFPPLPFNESACQWCDCSAICGAGTVAAIQRKAGDERLAGLNAIREPVEEE